MLERREFLIGCAATALAAGVGTTGCPSGEGDTAPEASGPVDLDREGFRALERQSFRIFGPNGEGHPVYAELAAVEDGPASPDLDQFVLRFRTDPADGLDAGLHELYHARMGTFHAHLDGSGFDGRGDVWVAHFSKFRPE